MKQIKEFFDTNTWTLTYVVWDDKTSDAIVIDPVLDYNPVSSKTSEDSAQAVIHFLKSNQLITEYYLKS